MQARIATLRAARRHRFRPDRVERGTGADRLRIDLQVQDRRLAGRLRGIERIGKLLGLLYRRAETTEGPRIRGEIRIAQEGGTDAPWKFALLMRADRAVHAVVHDQDDDRQIVLD